MIGIGGSLLTNHTGRIQVRGLLQQVLPLLYKETFVRKELIRIVEMGPFKQPFDDGLDCRKCTFECMHTLLETCASSLVLPEFLVHLVNGLGDLHDIVMLCHLMLIRIAAQFPDAILMCPQSVLAALSNTLDDKVSEGTVYS